MVVSTLESDCAADDWLTEPELFWDAVSTSEVVLFDELDDACLDLLRRATRGSRSSKALGKQGFYAQVDLEQPKAYAYAMELMASASQTPDAREGMASFLEKRPPRFD